jgi:FkbM family methyltransferase
MHRKLGDYVSLGALRNVKHLPVILTKIENWPKFLLAYLGFQNKPGAFVMRDGTKILTGEAVDAVTLMVVFIRQEYGKVPEDSVVIDIGANIGVFTVYAASTTRNTTVYAFEPMEHNYKILRDNIRINSLEKRIHSFELGVAAHAGERKLYLGGGSPYHSLYSENDTENSVTIDCISLPEIFDQQGLQRCDLLKLDCEGAEFEILYSTPEEYMQRINRIRLEYHDLDNSRNNIRELKHYLESKGFKETTRVHVATGYWNNCWFERIGRLS